MFNLRLQRASNVGPRLRSDQWVPCTAIRKFNLYILLSLGVIVPLTVLFLASCIFCHCHCHPWVYSSTRSSLHPLGFFSCSHTLQHAFSVSLHSLRIAGTSCHCSARATRILRSCSSIISRIGRSAAGRQARYDWHDLTWTFQRGTDNHGSIESVSPCGVHSSIAPQTIGHNISLGRTVARSRASSIHPSWRSWHGWVRASLQCQE